MKRIVSLIMAVLMLCALCVPALADVSFKDGAALSGEQVFDEKVTLKGDTTIENDASLTFNEGISFAYSRNCTLTVKNGASVTINGDMDVGNGNSIIIEPGAEVTLNGELYYLGDGSLEIGGKLTGRCGVDPGSASFTVSPGGIIDMEFEYEAGTRSLVNALKEYGAKAVEIDDGDYKWRVALCNHEHSYVNYICDCGKPCLHESWTDGVCDACQYVCTHEGDKCDTCGKEIVTAIASGSTASTLSEGSLAIVVGVAGVAVGMAVMFFIMKKKKTSNS